MILYARKVLSTSLDASIPSIQDYNTHTVSEGDLGRNHYMVYQGCF